jgi:phage gp36-like protein
MAYATQQDLIDRFGERELVQLTDRVNKPATTIDDVVVDRAIGDAEALADGYLAKAYALPLVAVPLVLTKVTCDVARYYLHGKAAEKDGPVLRAYAEATAWLRDVSRGLVVLDVGGEAAAPVGGGAVRTSGPERVFTRDSLCGL